MLSEEIPVVILLMVYHAVFHNVAELTLLIRIYDFNRYCKNIFRRCGMDNKQPPRPGKYPRPGS